jgi:hypothetical protein
MKELETVVIRRSNEENTVAILTCNRTKVISDASAFRDALRNAVSDWVDRTTDGRESYAENGNDFNLGDLAQWDDDPTLRKFMKLHGITGIAMQVFCDTEPAPGWDYDDNLVDEEQVNGLEDPSSGD